MTDTVQVKKAEGVRRAEFTRQRFEPSPPDLGETRQTITGDFQQRRTAEDLGLQVVFVR